MIPPSLTKVIEELEAGRKSMSQIRKTKTLTGTDAAGTNYLLHHYERVEKQEYIDGTSVEYVREEFVEATIDKIIYLGHDEYRLPNGTIIFGGRELP